MVKLNNVNIFLSAKSKEELVLLQVANNTINQIQYAYQTPTKDGKEWIVWFFADITEWINPNDATNESKRFVEGLS